MGLFLRFFYVLQMGKEAAMELLLKKLLEIPEAASLAQAVEQGGCPAAVTDSPLSTRPRSPRPWPMPVTGLWW